MGKVRITFLGSGDAFGSGGRLQACIRVESPDGCWLVDCGATVMTAMRRYGADPNAVDMILLSHLHGDHFGGIPFFVLDGQLISKRTRPLLIAGPVGTALKVVAAMELLFPGSSTVQRKFPLDIVELTPGQILNFPGLRLTPYPVTHTVAEASLALRIECGGQIIAYTGDTEWTEVLSTACRDADLVIAEAYYHDRKMKYHLDLQTLLAHWPEMQAKRLILTHMSEDMLARVGDVGIECAEDGKTIELG